MVFVVFVRALWLFGARSKKNILDECFFVDECTVIFFGVVEYTMVGSY